MGETPSLTFAEEVKSHFGSYLFNYPNRSARLVMALSIADPSYKRYGVEDDSDLPTDHHGYNLLAVSWGDSDEALRSQYQQVRELLHTIEWAPLGERVIIGPPRNFYQANKLTIDTDGLDILPPPTTIIDGQLASNEVKFGYYGSLAKAAKGKLGLKCPYIGATVSINLVNKREVYYDLVTEEPAAINETGDVNILTTASLFTKDRAAYRQDRIRDGRPILVGSTACAEYVEQLRQAYLIPNINLAAAG